ncbi:MAG: OmpA family protein [Bacteroidales bacterium]|nr:OmpA family protein [Bacteroidales bacterium]
MKKVLTLIAGVLLAATAFAQVEVENYDALRTNTWSPYVKGGVSLATGGDFKNINADWPTYLAPMAGLGIDYNILPWVRVGLGYEASLYKREQRLGAIEADGTTFRNLGVLYHGVDLTADFNIMEIWKNRACKAFNIYLGTGVGYMFAYGNRYDIKMGFNETVDPTPNTDTYKIETWVTAHNEPVKFGSPYIPANLSFEYDINPRLTLGLEAGVRYLLGNSEYMPKLVENLGVTLRWNIVGLRQGCRTKAQVINELRDKLAACAAANADCNARAAKLAADNADLEKQISDVRKKLADTEANCEALRKQLEDAYKAMRDKDIQDVLAKAVVYFANDSYKISHEAQETINTVADFLNKYDDIQVSLVGSANKTGTAKHNQWLSEHRVDAVRNALLEKGVAPSKIDGTAAVGDNGMTKAPECRRVVFTLE